MEKIVISLSNPLVKQARALRQRKARLASGLFLVEGIHHVGEALEAKWEVDSILYAPELLTGTFAKEILETASRRVIKLQPVSAQVMESIADKENPQGILALVHQRKTGLDELQSVRRAVALVSPQDPGNVGTILRTMDAVDVDALFMLDGGVDPYHPTAVRASMGTLFWKPVVQSSSDEFVAWSRKSQFQLIGTSAHGDVDYSTLIPQSPWILLLGNEQKGLSPEYTTRCDVTVALPMRGRVSSLNLAVAAGVLMYQYVEKR